MSEVKVNKLSPRSGTTVTIGDSGDTISIPSGVTLDASSGGLAGTLTTAAQPNITSVGTLTSFTSTGIDDNADATAITIDSSENVGIGTTSPSSILHAETTTGAELILSRNDTSIAVDDLIGGIQFKANDASSSPDPQICGIKAISTGATNTNPKLNFFAGESNYSANTPNMSIDSSGNVGIGTSASSLLHLQSASPNLIIQDTGTAGSDSAPAITFKDASSTQGTINFNNGGDMEIIQSTSNALKFKTSDTERARIDSSGKVGINTTAPYGKFEVHSGGGGSNYSGSSAIKSGVTWGSEASSHTISLFNYNENDNSSGMLLVHAKADNNKCGTLILLFTKKGGSGVSTTTVSSKTDGMSTFSASTSGNDINISTDSDCAICWQSYYGV